MQIRFTVKQLAKKKPFINALSLEIAGNYHTSYTLSELLTSIVTQQVEVFNQQRNEKSLFTFFQENELEKEAETGKVRFGAIYNETHANLDKAIETVLLAFYDGLIAVFIDDTQIEKLEDLVVIDENTSFTFVRLTFLVGSFW
jgi:hypothetical protein